MSKRMSVYITDDLEAAVKATGRASPSWSAAAWQPQAAS
jgi:hypothetical protein